MKKSEHLLYLINNMDGEIEGRTRVMFLSFKICQEKSDTYSFTSSKNGPYSKEINKDLKELDKKGLISISEETTPTGDVKYIYKLTEKGQEKINNIEKYPQIDKIINKHRDTPILILDSQMREKHPKLFSET